MSARDRLRDEIIKGNIWGEPHNLDQLIDDVIAEALTDPTWHDKVMVILRRESRIQGQPLHELATGDAPAELRIIGEEGCTFVLPQRTDNQPHTISLVVDIPDPAAFADAIRKLDIRDGT